MSSSFQNVWKEGEGSRIGQSEELATMQTYVEALKLRGPFTEVPDLGEVAGPLHLGLSRRHNLGPASSLQQRQFSKRADSCSQQSPRTQDKTFNPEGDLLVCHTRQHTK